MEGAAPLYISQVLPQQPIGLKPIDEQNWEIRYRFHLLGFLDERLKTIVQLKAGIKECKPCARFKM
jgi:hypothetical protein